MRAVVQRVCEASVRVSGEVVGGVRARPRRAPRASREGDDEAQAERLAGKVARLRIFENEDGRFDRSLIDVGGEALVVSQFTLIADTRKGNRPSFSEAARARGSGAALRALLRRARGEGVRVARGVFGARMEVALVNDGPVTIVLDA